MSEQRLIDANALPVYQRTIRYNTGEYELDYILADDVKNAPTIDAVSREEYKRLEEERDAYREAVKNIAGCLECVHFDNDASEDPPVCKTCKGMSNWQWCGAQKEVVSDV